MKENPKLISLTPKNVQINYFSKQLGKYDCELTFNKKLNLFLHLHKKTPIFNQKELQKIFYQNPKNTINNIKTNFTAIKSKLIQDKKNQKIRSFSPLDEISKKKRISYLPQISPYILSNKSSILIDYNKALEMGSNGFKIFCSNENKNIKEILFAYNDHNFQSLKDFNSFSYFNKRNETSNINIKKQNETEKNNINDSFLIENKILMTNNKDIFDEKFRKKNQITKIKKLLINKNNRIKNQNTKANKLYEQYKNLNIKKKGIKVHLNINYNSIEKHTPFTLLCSQTQRVSPEDMIHKYFNYNYQRKKKEKELLENKKIKIKKIKNEINKDKFFMTNKSINLCSDNIKNFII